MPPARPTGRPGRATAPSPRRSCRRAQVGLSHRSRPERLGPEEAALPSPATVTGAAGGKPARRPSSPGRPLRRPPAAEPRSCFAYARNDIPSARCPPETPRAPHLTATGISAPLPSRPGPPSGPLRPERPRSLRPARLSARPASTPGRGDRRPEGNPSDGRFAWPPFLPAPCGPPACPSGLRPALSVARGTPLFSGGPIWN